jgi:hypothetical protein
MDSGRNKNSDKRVKCPLQRGHKGTVYSVVKTAGWSHAERPVVILVGYICRLGRL